MTGDADTPYTITLPSSCTMITDGGGSTKEITINSFQSNPAEGSNGLLNGSGQQTIFVGATMQALLSNQTTGSYSGSFTITVVY